MIIVVLLVFGLALGSFVNALVWRVHEQRKSKKKAKRELSIMRGRSICPHCRHELAAKDLVPLFSWLSLRGRCRYCGKPVSAQYPIVEALTALLFVASYVWWPLELHGLQVVAFVLWLAALTGLMALTVYDLRWKLLPNRILYPVAVIAAALAIVEIIDADRPWAALVNTILAVAVGGGIFYVLFQFSEGKWIGGGDVKLGWVLGLIVGTPARSLLFIFLAALLGTLVSLPLLWLHRVKRNTTVPFGPFLILGAIITELFGHSILHWYQVTFLAVR